MKFLVTTILVLLSINIQAQVNDSDVLFTVDGDPILATEFIKVYNKNLDLVQDESQKDIDAYLELFIHYQLKIKEAKRLELDKDPNYIREFNNYRSQLTKNYMSESEVTNELVKEAYTRTTTDVNASHILIRMDENETDTISVYNQMMKMRDRVLNEGFKKIQNDVHNGQTIFAEDLGYFGAFKMVYPFESMAFNTPVGEVSMPFRTRFGYHIVIVNDRREALGEVTVAHIMVAKQQKDSTVNIEERIRQIYSKVQNGEKFESLAKQFSDDKSSSKKGGVLSPFTGGQLSSREFEEVAFSLEKPGDISEPFKTDFGWHIVKLIRKKGIQPFEVVKSELENRVKRDSRSNLISSALANKLASQYKVTVNTNSIDYFKSIIAQTYFKQSWKPEEDFKRKDIILTIEDQSLTNAEFLDQLLKKQRTYYGRNMNTDVLIDKEFQSFKESQILKYHEANLEYVNEDFAFVLKEYRDGLLLFDLMEKEVWNAATKDTVGLKSFYNANKLNYKWDDRADAVIFTSASKFEIESVQDKLQKKTAIEDVINGLNKKGKESVITTSDIFEKGNGSLPTDFEFKKGVSKVLSHNDAYHVIWVREVIPAGIKSLDEARGRVVSDYQSYLENEWITSLSERFEVKRYPSVLKRVKQQLQAQ